MAIVRTPPQRDVVWNLQRAGDGVAQAAQVTAAELTSVLSLDGSLRTHARYRVRNRGQQFLALQLPESARLLSVLVKGEPARGLSAAIGETWATPTQPDTWVAMVFLVLGGSVAVFGLFVFLLGRWDVSAVSYTLLLQPLATIAYSAVLTH